MHKKKLKMDSKSNIKGYTETKILTVKDIINAINKEDNIAFEIVIPKFQRSLRWDKERKKKLITSIKNDFPIGSLLLYVYNADKNGTTYGLIDGLQRVSTLKSHSENPTEYFTDDEIDNQLIFDIVRIINKEEEFTNDLCKNRIISWVEEVKGFGNKDGFTPSKLITHLTKGIKDIGINRGNKRDDLEEISAPFLDKVKETSTIDNYQIPAIIYSGDSNNLPIIFELLNKQGILLSKYEMFAATWTSIYEPINISNKDIITEITNKYNDMINQGYEIEGYTQDSEILDFTYFEYFLGLGKWLRKSNINTNNKLTSLFLKTNPKEESLGFNISAVCLGLSIEQINKKLPNTFQIITKDNDKLFEKCLKLSIETTAEILSPYISAKLNKHTSSKARIHHTEAQVIAIIATVFQIRFDIKNNLKENIKSYKKELKEIKPLIQARYLYDIIRGYWSRKGYSLISEYKNTINKKREINSHEWGSVLDEWFYTTLERKEKTRKSFSTATYLFLKYIYVNRITVFEENSETFHIEHIIPIEKLQKNFPDGISMNNIANLCLIPKPLNLGKSSKTLYEYADKQIKAGKMNIDEIKEHEKLFMTERKDLEFCYGNRKTITEETYENFLLERFTQLKLELFTQLRIEKTNEPKLFY